METDQIRRQRVWVSDGKHANLDCAKCFGESFRIRRKERKNNQSGDLYQIVCLNCETAIEVEESDLLHIV